MKDPYVDADGQACDVNLSAQEVAALYQADLGRHRRNGGFRPATRTPATEVRGPELHDATAFWAGAAITDPVTSSGNRKKRAQARWVIEAAQQRGVPRDAIWWSVLHGTSGHWYGPRLFPAYKAYVESCLVDGARAGRHRPSPSRPAPSGPSDSRVAREVSVDATSTIPAAQPKLAAPAAAKPAMTARGDDARKLAVARILGESLEHAAASSSGTAADRLEAVHHLGRVISSL